MNDPYAQLDERQIVRTTINLSGAASSQLKSLHNRRGTLQLTIANLVEKLISSLIQHGITTYDPEQYEAFVDGCVIVPNGAAPHEPIQAAHSNERRGASRVARGAKG